MTRNFIKRTKEDEERALEKLEAIRKRE